jgi:hypothetical protein
MRQQILEKQVMELLEILDEYRHFLTYDQIETMIAIRKYHESRNERPALDQVRNGL